VIAFVPVSNLLFPIGTIMGERLFYLPSVGLCLLAGLAWERATTIKEVRRATFDVPNRISETNTARRTSHVAPLSSRYFCLFTFAFCLDGARRTFLLRSLLVILCLALTLRTVVRTQDWANNEALFRSAVQVVPRNAKAHALLGDELKRKTQEGREQAMAAYQTALGLYPDYLTTHAGFGINFGNLLFDLGRTEEALKVLKMAVEANPQWSVTYYNIGLVHAKLEQYDKAEEAWRHALSLRPEDPQVHSSLSRLAIARGRYAEGLAAAEAALARDPEFVWAQYNRALALQALGRLEEAAAGYERVLALPSAPEEAKQDVIRRLRDLRAQAGSEHHPARMCVPGLAGC
jgi:Tfp pilus assembly protein PilF